MTEEGESSAAVAEDGDRAAPQPDAEKSPRTDIRSDATAAEKGRGAETAPAASPDGRSFLQPISGAKASPSGSPRPPPILTIPVVAVPCFLAPAALIESPGFAGQFAMTHQAVLATVTAQAHVQMQAAYPLSSETMTSTFPHCMLPAASPVSLQQMSPASETYSGDVYHWRKYGQKQVKNTENSRSYYRCANSNCLAKKKVECCPDGKIQEVIYKGKHDHDPPQKYRYTRDRGAQSSGPSRDHESLEHQSNEPIESGPLACKTEHNSGNETPEQRLYCSSDCEGDAGIMTEKDLAEEPDPKRRLSESSKSSTMSVPKTVREYIVQTEIDARHLSDGYRWRKYGQKFVKGNPNPRSYYRCTHDGCPVRKHVERASHDAKSLLITYEGKHSHDQPMPRHGSDQPAIDSSTSATGEDSLSDKNSSKDLNPKNIVKKVAGDEAPASAQAVTSIKDGSAVKEPTLMV